MGQLLANNAASTLSAGITAGAVSLIVANAATFPVIVNVGTDYFYLTLSDLAEDTWEIVKVTATVGTAFTIVRGVDGTTALPWAGGVNVQIRPCAQMLKDLATVGSGLPACTAANNGQSLQVVAGAPVWGGPFPWIPITLTPPNPSAFTWVNQSANGGATATLQVGQTTLYFPVSSGNSISAMQVSYSGNKRCVASAYLVSLPNSGATSAGIYVGDGSGKLIEFSIINYSGGAQDSVLWIYEWSSPTVPSSALYSGFAIPPCPGPLFLSVYDDGTNLNFQVSIDGGQNWDTLFQQARSSFLTAGPSTFGWGARTEGVGKHVRANFLHWSVG